MSVPMSRKPLNMIKVCAGAWCVFKGHAGEANMIRSMCRILVPIQRSGRKGMLKATAKKNWQFHEPAKRVDKDHPLKNMIAYYSGLGYEVCSDSSCKD